MAAATVRGAEEPAPGPPLEPDACAPNRTLREILLPPPAPVTWESTGRPTVTQSTETTGSATTAGRNRPRALALARGARMRRGRSLYECRKILSFGRRRPQTDARRKAQPGSPQEGDSPFPRTRDTRQRCVTGIRSGRGH